MYNITDNAIKYTLDLLFSVAVPNGLVYDVEIGECAVSVKIKEHVITFPIMRGEYASMLSGAAKYCKIKSLTGDGSVPLFFADCKRAFFKMNGSTATICGDVITPSFIMLSRCEELEPYDTDGTHDFPFSQSIACKYDFIDIPIVDEYGLHLRGLLRHIMPDLEITPNQPKLIPTHDIDDIERFSSIKRFFTSIATDLFRLKSPKIALKSAGQAIKSLYSDDPNTHALKYLCDFSRQLGFTSEFNFMGSSKRGYDRGYTYSKRALEAVSYIAGNGAVLGFHPGYYTTENPDLFASEKAVVEAAIGQKVVCGRQHYLRFKADVTFNTWEKNGMRSDSTLGYSEREGFRCGTCHEFAPYDLQADKQFESLTERPLIVMDGTLEGYRKMTVVEGYETAKHLMERCKKAEGNFVILWHNTGLTRGMEKWFADVYCKVLSEF